MLVFNIILQGHETTEEQAIEYAAGADWSGVDTTEQEKPAHSTFISCLNGVDVYYCYGADHYFFTEIE